MGKFNSDDFSFKMKDNFDFILQEAGNSSVNLRKIAWGNSENFKLDIRKWVYKDGQETAMKGVTMTEEGGHELACILVENGYGDTRRLMDAIKKRNNIDDVNSDEEDDYDEEDANTYFDPKELIS